MFDAAAAELDRENSTYRINSFMDSFKQTNGSRIVALLTPTAPDPANKPEEQTSEGEVAPEKARPKTVSLGRIVAKGYGKPTIQSKQDVEDYIDALRIELEKQIDDGNIVMR